MTSTTHPAILTAERDGLPDQGDDGFAAFAGSVSVIAYRDEHGRKRLEITSGTRALGVDFDDLVEAVDEVRGVVL